MTHAHLEQRLTGSDRELERTTTAPSDRDSYRRFLAEQSEAAKVEERVTLTSWVKDRRPREESERVRISAAD